MNRKLAAGIERLISITAVVAAVALLGFIGLQFLKGTYEMGVLIVLLAVGTLAIVVVNERDTLGI